MHRLALSCIAVVLLGLGGRATPQAPSSDPLEQAYRFNNTGAAWMERFDYQQAAQAFRDALRLAPTLAIARLNLALALLYGGNHEEAEREARAAAPLVDSPHGEYVLGLVARAQGRAPAAAAAFERVLQRDPSDADAAVMLGQVKLQQGDAPGAIALLQTALAAEPHNATAAYNLSIALSRAGRSEEAKKALAHFQTLRDTGTATTMGNSYLEQGRYAEAIVSTGGEPDLVDRAVPRVRFVAETLGAGTSPRAGSTDDPVGRRFEAADLDAAGRRRIAAALAGGITLFDADGDGDLDLLEAGTANDRLWRNTRGRFAISATARFPRRSPEAVTTGFVAGDYDNDGRPDVLALRYGGPALYRNAGAGRFTDVTARAGLRSGPAELPLTAAFADLDHDGDLDIVIPGFVDLAAGAAAQPLVFPDDFPSAPARVWRNNGNGTFADITGPSAIAASRAVATVPTDFDLRRDVDLLIAGGDGRVALFRNLRDGSFRDVAGDSGLTSSGAVDAVAAGDLNRDGRTDFVIAQRGGQVSQALSTGRTRFRMDQIAGLAAVTAAHMLDYDNDGLLDLIGWTTGGARLMRSLGAGGWQDVTDTALAAAGKSGLPPLASGRAIAAGDLDADGDQDLVVQDRGEVRLLRNDGGNRRGGLSVRLVARVSNRSATGSKVEMRAGSLLVRRETSAATPAAAPADLIFGLGGRQAADAIRVLWPAGIVQAELQPRGSSLVVNELDRKPSSCPYLFTWNGSRFEFVTDFLGGGELGYWAAPGVRSHPDSDEYVRIPRGALAEKDGRYELRITNELEEVLYLDHVRLVAVAHPAASDIYPNEGLVSPPFPRPTTYAVTNQRTPLAVIDDHGHDMTEAVRALDRRFADDFALTSIRGYAEPHALTIRVDDRASVLLLTGWTDYAFSSDNVAASQRGLHLSPPALQVRDGAAWRTAVTEIGIPVGRPQTIPVDLRRPELAGRREFRIVTNMRVYWDRIAAADVDERTSSESVRLDAAIANLTWRGFSVEATPDGREPYSYDYARVGSISPWKTMTGSYTPAGDVRPLLAAIDDRFVVARPGDEIAVSFDAAPLRPLPQGWTRTFLLYADGFSKEMDLNSASPDQVEPMPFHAMRGYPPAPAAATREETPQSRRVKAQLPSIDALILLARPSPVAADEDKRPPWPPPR